MSKRYYIPTVKPTKKDKYDRFIWSRLIDITATTNGRGFWSREIRKVNHKKMQLSCFGKDPDLEFAYGYYELRVFFNQKNWNTKKHGLIYTDRQWEKDFKRELINMGFSKSAVKNCNFSEQGMQGDNYISLDAGPKFAKDYFKVLYSSK